MNTTTVLVLSNAIIEWRARAIELDLFLDVLDLLNNASAWAYERLMLRLATQVIAYRKAQKAVLVARGRGSYRNMARRIQTYPWITSFILTQDNLCDGWGHHDEEDDEWLTFTEIERIAAKVSTCEQDIFQGDHSTEIMATRRHLEFELYEATPTSSLRRLAAETSRALTSISHGNAPARGNSLLTSYRLLDILAFQFEVHPGICRYPAEKPSCPLPTSTHLLDKWGHHLSDIKTLLYEFKTSWEESRKTRRTDGKASTNDLFLVHIKQTLTIDQLSHAQKVERNLLAAALPITIMIMDEPFSAASDEAGVPLPPEMLDGLDSFVQTKYLPRDCFSTADKAKIVTLYTKPNIRNMRKPHAVSVHTSPLLHLLNVNWQKSDVSEEDLIKTSRIIGTHDNPLLDDIERCLWRAILHIANGVSPIVVIDDVVEQLPWDDIDLLDLDDEMNQRFKPNRLPLDLSQCSPPRKTQLQSMQAFFDAEYSNPLQQPIGTGAPSVNAAAHMAPKRKRKSGKYYRIQTVPAAPILPSANAQSCEGIPVLDTANPITSYNTEEEWTFYDPLGGSCLVNPSFHFSETRDSLFALHEAIESSYTDGKPRYISAPEESVIQVVDSAQRTAREVQQLLRNRHVVEVEVEQARPPLKFDLKTLSTLGPLHRPIIVQDESISDDSLCRVFTLAGLYEIQDSGRAVRTFEMPTRLEYADLCPFSTDRRAYDYRKYCPEKDHSATTDRPFPLHDMEWSLVSLKGATRDVCISPDGAGTFVECLVGCEWYILLRPKGGLDHRQFGNVEHFHQNANRLDDLVLNYFEVEAFLLQSGMRGFIRPSTPYCVLTLENTITQGSYFYSLSTMQDSFFGLVHNFASTSSITQSRIGQPFRHVIRTIIQYVHNTLIHQVDTEMPLFSHAMDPDLLTIDDVEDLLSVICIGILSNALDQNTYKLRPQTTDKHLTERLAQARSENYDYNALPYDDRIGCTLARGFSYQLRDWFCHYYSIQGHDVGAVESTMTLTQKIIAHQACVLLKAKTASEEAPDAVKYQISNTFPKDSAESAFLADYILRVEQGDEWSSEMYISLQGCSLSKIDDPAEFHPRSIDEILTLGMSPLDEEYERGRECSFEVHIEGGNKKRHT